MTLRTTLLLAAIAWKLAGVLLVMRFRRRVILAWRRWRLAAFAVRILECQTVAHFYELNAEFKERHDYWSEEAERLEKAQYNYTCRILGKPVRHDADQKQ
ncbi:MAG: hypothetical protein WCT44_02595 [Candidatus Paceibacterota bacterium]